LIYAVQYCLDKYRCKGSSFEDSNSVTSSLIFNPPIYFQNDRELAEVQGWALICDTLLSRPIRAGTLFQLRQGELSLLVSVHALPHLHLTEEIIEPKSNKFVLRMSSETSV
jgi:vang-like